MNNELIQEAIDKFKEKYPDIHIIFLNVSGSHLYGTHTKNSDYDLRGCFIYNTKEILINPKKSSDTIEFTYKNVEITVHEIHKLLSMIYYSGNMNFIEETLSSLNIITTQYHDKIKEIAQESLTKEMFVHIQGMSIHTKKHAEKENYKNPKRDLYIIRELLRGIILFKSGKLYSDVNTLALKYDNISENKIVDTVKQLIELKRMGKQVHFASDIVKLISDLEGEMLKAKEFGILKASKRLDVEKKLQKLLISLRKKFLKN